MVDELQTPAELVEGLTPDGGKKAERVRKPRQSKPKADAALILRFPTTAAGVKNTTLFSTVTKKFVRIAILDQTGKSVKAVVKPGPGDKVAPLGSATINFIYALVDSVLAGQGSGPDGSALFVNDNATKVIGWWNAPSHGTGHFHKLILKCEPAGRSGAASYMGSIDEYVAIAKAKALLITRSIKSGGVAKALQRTQPEKVNQAPTIKL